MRRTVTVAILLAALLSAGCLGTPTPTATPESGTATPTADTTGESPTTTAGSVSVTYHVDSGTLPPGLVAANATVRVVFAERGSDLGPCWAGVFRGPYQPTITPIGTPAGDCRRAASTTLALGGNDSRQVTATAPGSFDAGHAVVVTDVRATTANGSTTTAIRGTGGQEVHVVEGLPTGPYRVALGLEPAPESADYDYVLVSTVAAGD